MPITLRQLESLIRLAQARARAELRDWVTEDDALDVVEMMQEVGPHTQQANFKSIVCDHWLTRSPMWRDSELAGCVHLGDG